MHSTYSHEASVLLIRMWLIGQAFSRSVDPPFLPTKTFNQLWWRLGGARDAKVD